MTTEKDISRKLTKILRHTATSMGIPMTSDGWILFSDLKSHLNLSLQDLQRIVDSDNKSRYSLNIINSDQVYIRANQGHSLPVQIQMKPLTLTSQVPNVIHGTFKRNLESILHTGLSRMKRLHIHFAFDLPSNKSVKSGIRSDCDVFIFMDISKALQDGIEFYISENQVILSPGLQDGRIPKQYFSKIIDKNGNYLDFS